jgi:putative ABC transport system permease protein
MFRHYLVTALRSLARHRLYSCINIVGFAVGIACAILITLYVRSELSYDTWIPNTSNLYRLEAINAVPGREPIRMAQAPFPVVTAVRDQIREVEAAVHVMPETVTINAGEQQFREKLTLVDPNFFSVIELPLVRGDPSRVLAQPESVVISQSMAHKFFGTTDPVGKILHVALGRNDACGANDRACLSATYPLQVTGILRDLPYNTQLVADFVVPNTSRADQLSPREKAQDWTASDFDFGYVKLGRGVAPATVLSRLNVILDRSFDPKVFGIQLRSSQLEQYHLTPFRSSHLTSDQYYGMRPAGSWTTVYGLTTIGALIVLVACFNFMNLATARATLRAREIALRKLGGARRGQLIAQFLGEAVLTALLSLVIGLALVEVLLPVFDRIVQQPIGFHYGADWPLLAAIIAATVVVGLVSGLYPALVLSTFRPATSLKGGATLRAGPSLLRSTLVVAQFAVSIGLGITAAVVFRQIDFARKVELGFRRDGMVVVTNIAQLTPDVRDGMAHALNADARILGVAYSDGVPFNLFNISNPVANTPGGPRPVPAQLINFDPQYPDLYDMRLLSGRLLSRERGEDISTRGSFHNVLINATAAHQFGFTPESAIGKEVVVGSYARGTIVGVLSDPHLGGIRDSILPGIYFFDESDSHAMTLLSVRLRGDDMPGALSFIDKTWHAFVPATAIDRYFLSDAFETLFEPDVRQGEILAIFVGISICIACLGLFGLAVFTAERRTKEIGVRKIAGARTVDIVQRLLWQISIPVLIANAVAWPLAYYYLARWLEGYAYRIALTPLYFAAAGAVALVIAWSTVFTHSLRLARASPIHALRYE